MLCIPIGYFAPTIGPVLVSAIHDAYIQVASFVALTLFLLILLQRWLRIDLDSILMRHARWHVPIATLFGMLPGCGGAIVMVTQFCRGYLSFGALTASLVATMGDAAFVLIAQKPAIAALVIGVQLIVGMVSGYTVERLMGRDFLRPRCVTPHKTVSSAQQQAVSFNRTEYVWIALIIPGLALGLANALQWYPATWLEPISPRLAAAVPWFGFLAGLFAIGMWIQRPSRKDVIEATSIYTIEQNDQLSSESRAQNPLQKAIGDTNFVFVWVALSFVAFEALFVISGFDPKVVLDSALPLLPLFAIIAGFIPGCGPQIIVTTMYVADFIPLSAQLGNAISNDGDALFPALVLAPKQALIATVISAIPALLVAYGWFFFFELG